MSSRKRKQDEEEELVSLPEEEDGEEEEEYISTGENGEEEEEGDEEADNGDESEEDDAEEEDEGLNGDEADAKSASNGTNGVESAEENNGIADVNQQPPVKKRKTAGGKVTEEAANGDATGNEDHVAKDAQDDPEAAKNTDKAVVAPIEAEEPEKVSTESAIATAVVGADDEDK